MSNLLNLKRYKQTALDPKIKIAVIGAALAVLFLTSVFSLYAGTVSVPWKDIAAYFTGGQTSYMTNHIIGRIRFPRILTGILVGMNIAVAGVLLQGVLKNPMASPNIIGATSGAGFAVISVMAVYPQFILFIPLAAFFGALFATVLIFFLTVRRSGKTSTVHIVLAGVAVTALLNAVTHGIMIINSDVLDITFSWTLGTLSGKSWSVVKMILPYSFIGLFAAVFISPKVNLFSLGDEVASSVGLKTGFYRRLIIIIASVLSGSAIAAAGTIGFIGLVAPHISRLLIGNDYKYLLPLSALMGALLLVVSDIIARTVFQPVELSVGIVTAVLGAPFFIFLLRQNISK